MVSSFFHFLFFPLFSFFSFFAHSDTQKEISTTIAPQKIIEKKQKKIPIHILQENFTVILADIIIQIEEKINHYITKNKNETGKNDILTEILRIFHWAVEQIQIIKNDPTAYGRKELEKESKTAEEYLLFLKKI